MTPPLLVAAAVLCAAGALKLRSPAAAIRAIAELGLPAPGVLVRLLAIIELMVGGWCAVDPVPPATVALACLYGTFAGAAVLLVRRRVACGCFGEGHAPASLWQSIVSAALALVAIGATLWPAHGVRWVLGRPAIAALALVLGTAGAAYATVIAYTELPRAWGSWSAR